MVGDSLYWAKAGYSPYSPTKSVIISTVGEGTQITSGASSSPLSSEKLQGWSVGDQKKALSAMLPLVREIEPRDSSVITEMIMEMDTLELVGILESPGDLKEMVSQALNLRNIWKIVIVC